jgi:CheY-like chemotaxis protein
MKLVFQLLVVDDNPDSINNSVARLADHLNVRGFTLEVKVATGAELSPANLKALAKQFGKEFNLVAVDYNLGRRDVDGARAAQLLRARMRFTDMIFYSSDPGVRLFDELAKQSVAGVFVSSRDDLDENLIGLADTVIGKAVDLNHMRGIAMAEVADMDTMMEGVLEKIFSCPDPAVAEKAQRTLEKLLEGGRKGLEKLDEMVRAGDVLAILPNTEVFGSGKRYQAINRVAAVLKEKPDRALQTFKSFEGDIIAARNTLAHAKADVKDDGTVTLRSAKRGAEPVVIDDDWMAAFRGKLRVQRQALGEICGALERHAAEFVSEEARKT